MNHPHNIILTQILAIFVILFYVQFFFLFGNFSKTQSFSLSTYIDFLEKLLPLSLFPPDSL